MTLTKAQIVDIIHEELPFPKNKSTEVVEGLIEIIKSTLEKGEDVLVSGFGKFCVKLKRERRGRNPQSRPLLLARFDRAASRVAERTRALRRRRAQGLDRRGARDPPPAERDAYSSR